MIMIMEMMIGGSNYNYNSDFDLVILGEFGMIYYTILIDFVLCACGQFLLGN